MKKLLLMICLMVLLGQFPLEAWEKGTPEQQMAFVQEIAQEYMKASSCKESNISAMTDGKMVFIVAECLDDGKVSL